MHHPTDKITHTTAFVTPVVEHWLEREIAQWVHSMKDRSDDPSHHLSYVLLPGHLEVIIIIIAHLGVKCLICQESNLFGDQNRRGFMSTKRRNINTEMLRDVFSEMKYRVYGCFLL